MKILSDISDFARLDFKEEKINHLIDTQINKGWSKKIRGVGRYKEDLNQNEIDIVNKIAQKGIKQFNYD